MYIIENTIGYLMNICIEKLKIFAGNDLKQKKE